MTERRNSVYRFPGPTEEEKKRRAFYRGMAANRRAMEERDRKLGRKMEDTAEEEVNEDEEQDSTDYWSRYPPS